jgi:hypothetical protein
MNSSLMRDVELLKVDRPGPSQPLCLSVVVNAIIVWNTVYTQRVLDQFRGEGRLITTSALEQIPPLARTELRHFCSGPLNKSG